MKMPPRTYKSVIAGLPRSEEQAPPEAPETAVGRLLMAAEAGDLAAVKALMAPSAAEAKDPEEAAAHAERALLYAAGNGRLRVVKWLHAQGVPINKYSLGRAAMGGHLPTVKWLHAHGADVRADEDYALRMTAEIGSFASIKYLHALGANIRAKNDIAMVTAAGRGDLRIAKWLHAHGAKIDAQRGMPLMETASDGHLPMVKWLHAQGANIAKNQSALHNAVAEDHLPVVKYLVAHGADIRNIDYNVIENLACKGRLSVLGYLQKQGFDIEHCKEEAIHQAIIKGDINAVHDFCKLAPPVPEIVTFFMDNMQEWNKRHGRCPAGLHDLSPLLFRARAFDDVLAMLKEEHYVGAAAHNYAYNTAGLFGTTDRVLAYLERWGESTHHPLHDAIQNIELPQEGRANLAAWADACLRHGSKMTRLVKFAGLLPEPEKDPKGQWSYTLTRAQIARNAYEYGEEYPDLAARCFAFDWDNDQFEDAVRAIIEYGKKYGAADAPKPGGRIPDVAIDGALFDKPAHRFYKLPDGDARGLLLGEFTNCCQHLAGVGADCAAHGFLSEQSGFYVVADKKTDEIIAQGWAWRGTKNELALDSLESLPGHMAAPQWRSLCDEFARQARADKTAAVTAVHIGTGGATPDRLGYKTAATATPRDYNGYRDSQAQYVVPVHSARPGYP